MKKLVVALLFLILLLLLVPGAVGLVAENQFRKLSGNLDSGNTGVRLVVEDYRRGWFNSRARYRLSPEYPELEGYLRRGADQFTGWPSLIIEAQIVHGPIPFGALGREGASWLPAIAQSFDSISVSLGDGELISVPAKMTTRLGFFGHHSNEIRVAPFTHTFSDSDEPGRLSWSGMQLTTRFGPALDKVALSGESGPMEITSGDIHFRAGPARLESQQGRGEHTLWTGGARLTWEGMRIDAADKFFLVGKISAESSSDIEGGMYGQTIAATLAEVDVGGWKGGPGKFSMALARFDAQALGELTAIMSEVPLQGDEADFTAVLPLVFPQLQALLAGGPHIALRELSLETPDGIASVTVDLAFPKSSPEAAFGFILGLEGDARLELPASLLDKLAPEDAERMRVLLDIGFLVRRGDTLQLDAAVKGGLLTVNGQPIPLPLGF